MMKANFHTVYEYICIYIIYTASYNRNGKFILIHLYIGFNYLSITSTKIYYLCTSTSLNKLKKNEGDL